MIAQRIRVLRALGVTPWALRAAPEQTSSSPEAVAGEAPLACAVILPSQPAPRVMALLERSLTALAPGLATVMRASLRLDTPGAVLPAAQIYFVFGAQAAQFVHQHMGESAVQRIELAEPAALLSAAGKRRLWEGWRALRHGTPAV